MRGRERVLPPGGGGGNIMQSGKQMHESRECDALYFSDRQPPGELCLLSSSFSGRSDVACGDKKKKKKKKKRGRRGREKESPLGNRLEG